MPLNKYGSAFTVAVFGAVETTHNDDPQGLEKVIGDLEYPAAICQPTVWHGCG